MAGRRWDIMRESVSLTDAQIKTLPTTPVALVAAPGANLRIALLQVEIFGNFTAGAYTNLGTYGYAVCQQGGIDVTGYLANDPSTLLDDFSRIFGSASKTNAVFYRWAPTNMEWGSAVYGETNASSLINAALNIAIVNDGAGNLTGGNGANSLKVRTLYTVESD